jgi:NAD(P)H-hydrate epimerase
MTPHPGEAGRLLGRSTEEVGRDRAAAARALAGETGAVAVLKGRRTLIAAPAGPLAVNPTGNPGLATAGTGDVLAGVLGAALARGHDAWPAAVAAAYVHGLAGDRAAGERGVEGLLAGDLVEALPQALRAVAGGGRPSA